jgi:signal transduction histidine kinase
LEMPTMDGWQVLSEVQRHTPGTPVLIFTDASEVQKAVEAMKLGAAGYVLKGASDAELANEVRAALARRRESEHRRVQMDRLATMGTLAAGVAHEINNPLAYVTSNLAFIRRALEQAPTAPLDADDRADALQALRETEQGIERISQIVRDIKSLSRRDEQKIPVNLREVLESAARMAAPAIRKHARLEVQIHELPVVLGDAGRLSQVIINLLVNAAQAIQEGSPSENEVRLVARKDEHNGALIEIHDTGSGMTAEVKARLFEPFFTTKPAGVGTGLGLSISHSIVTAQGGSMTVESEPGSGSVFRVRLPATSGLS